MTMLPENSFETTCPQCGRPMGLVSYVGKKPTCNSCADVNSYPAPASDNTGCGCLHEEMSKYTPNHLDGAHMLACPCPKCSPTL